MRAHERFVQYASVVSSSPCSTARGREHVITRSCALWSCVGACTEEFMYESQYFSTVLAHQGFVLLCTSAQCDPTRALCSVLVLTPQGFVLLCTSVRCEPKRTLYGTNPQGRCTVCWYSPTKAWYLVLMCSCGSVRCELARALCFCMRCEPKGLCAVRAQRALCDASLQGLYTVCWCSPPRAFVMMRDLEFT